MSQRPDGRREESVVIPFRPPEKPPEPPKPALQWRQSVRMFLILFALIGVLRILFAGEGLGWFDLAFVVALAGAIAAGDFLTRNE